MVRLWSQSGSLSVPSTLGRQQETPRKREYDLHVPDTPDRQHTHSRSSRAALRFRVDVSLPLSHFLGHCILPPVVQRSFRKQHSAGEAMQRRAAALLHAFARCGCSILSVNSALNGASRRMQPRVAPQEPKKRYGGVGEPNVSGPYAHLGIFMSCSLPLLEPSPSQ